MERCDVIIIGGGIAGASLAMRLAARGRQVVMLEAEEHPGVHATGRSAAYFAPGYGNAVVRELTLRSAAFFETPPDGFSETPLLRSRAALFVARADQLAALHALHEELGTAVHRLDPLEAIAQLPILRPDYVAGAILDSRGGDADAAALLQGCLRQARRDGAVLKTAARAAEIRRERDLWIVAAGDTQISAPVIVNAAGAWADTIATLAGLAPLGLTPLRRSAVLVPAPKDQDIANWPFVVDADEDFYFKPDAGALLLSPADETPSEPCDAQPEEIDIAVAVDRIEQATTLQVRRVTHRWAGLRTFAPDRSPVAGFDPRAPGFFWLAGQGGYGVQTAPALSEFAAELIVSGAAGGDLAAALSPARFAG